MVLLHIFLRVLPRTLYRAFAITSLVMLPAQAGAAAPTLVVGEQLAVTPLGNFLDYYVQSEGPGTIEEIAALPDSAFSTYGRPVISEGFTPDVWWFRARLRNESSQPVLLHLDRGSPFLDRLEVFMRGAAGYTRVHNRSTFQEASGQTISFLVPGDFESNVYLRVESSAPMIAPLRIASNPAFLQQSRKSQWVSGMVYGGLFALLLYNLLLLATVRERLFFSFVLYICALMGALAGVDGLIHEMLPGSETWPTTLTFMSLNLAIGMLALLTMIAGGENQASAKCRLIGSLLAGLNAVAMQLLLFLPLSQAIIASITVAIVSLGLTTLLAACQLRQAPASIRPHLCASIAFNISGVAVLLAFVGVLPNFPLALAVIKITVAAKLGLLSLALGQRVNELKRAQTRLEGVARLAVSESRASNLLLEKIGHRIRTPLNGVIGLTEALGNTRLDREQRQALSGIQQSGESLMRVLNDAMDYSLIEAGNLSLETGNYDLETVLNDCITLSSFQARQKQLEISLCIRPGTPVELRGDPARVRQIVMYLLSNALEHTGTGAINLLARQALDRAGRTVIRISVSDTGSGIARDVQSDLFNPHAELGGPSSLARSGSGLGLSISKKLVEMMGGTIGCRSAPEVGSTVWIDLPEKKSLLDVFTRKHSTTRGDRRQAVLIVDAHGAYTGALMDDRVTRTIDLRTASNIETAWRSLNERERSGARFDLVLLDESSLLSGALGAATEERLQAIRNMTKTALMKSRTDESERFPMRFTFEVEKPCSGRQLESVVQNVLIGEPAAQLDNWSQDEELRQQLAELKVLVVDDNEVSIMVTCGFLQRMGIREADVALDGEEALARFRANRASYDLVLMDCEMPRMDGYQATRAIREWESSKRLAPTTILAISAHVSPEMSRKSLDAGMQDHIPKPLQFASLRDKLVSLFPGRERPMAPPAIEAA